MCTLSNKYSHFYQHFSIMESLFIAQISLFAGNFAPNAWAFCDGQLLPIDEYDALFSLIGTTYGGDGQTTFALPDFRSRIPVGTGTGSGLSTFVLGQAAGVESTVVSASQMALHNHTALPSIPASTGNATTNNPNGNILAATSNNYYAPTPPNISMAGVSKTVQNTGGSSPVTIDMPVFGLHFVICLFGVYPTQ